MSWSITKAAALAAVCSASLAAVAISSAGAQEGSKASSSTQAARQHVHGKGRRPCRRRRPTRG